MPFDFILMIEGGSSPERIQNAVKTYKKQVTQSNWYERAQGQKAYSLILNASQGKEGWSTGKLVALQPQIIQFRQLAQFSRNGTWGIQNSVKSYKIQLSYWCDRQGKSSKSYRTQVKERRGERVPVRLLSNNHSTIKFANRPNSAGMGPGEYKTQSKHTKNKSPYPTGTKHTKNKSPYSKFEYIPVNEQFERSKDPMLSDSPVSKGRVNPMFPYNRMLTPFDFILMIEIGSSPERIQNAVKIYKKQVTQSDWYERV